MSGRPEQPHHAAVQLRMVAHPVSVSAARRFARDTLAAWQLPELTDDVTLCVSEMTSNAALHSASRYFDLAINHQPGAVDIFVDDQGPIPAAAVVRSGSTPDGAPSGGRHETATDMLSATGRGLVIVSALASEWGVETTELGKRVWARLPLPGMSERGGAPSVASPHPVQQPTGQAAGLPHGWHVVRLVRCPVWLGLRQDRHLDELVRELQLVDASTGPHPHALAEVIQGLLQGQAHARHLGRRVAQDAAAAGLDEIDIDMPVPATASIEVRQLHQAVVQADALCEREALLTLASDREVMRLREWMVHELVQQIELGEPPQSYPAWLDQVVNRPSGAPVQKQRQHR